MARYSDKDLKILKRLRFQFKIINFIWKLTYRLNSRIEHLKDKNRNTKLAIARKYQNEDLANAIKLLADVCDGDNKYGNKSIVSEISHDKI